ncbi:MAG: M48 family metalloprotease [Candidatus Rokuibacteriota bacterium]
MGKAPLQQEEDERRIWARSQEEQRRLEASGHLYDDPELEAYIARVLERVRPPEVSRGDLSLRVRVIKNPLLNAFTYPNGAIYVHTGILARIDNEAQLATLLAHELAHASHRHAVTRFRDIQNKTAFISTFQVMAAPWGLIGLVAQALGTVGAIAAIYGHSQEQELEADREGLRLMTRAGYDPREAPKLFLHLRQWIEDEKKPEPFFFGTHPRLAERTASYESLLAGEFRGAAAQGGEVGGPEFLARTRRALLDNAVLDLQAGRFVQTQKTISKYLALDPHDAAAHYYLGESYRRSNDPQQREQALAHYREAIGRAAGFPEPYRGLGTLHYQAGNRTEARRAFAEYLRLAPGAKDRPYIEGLLEELGEDDKS